LFIEKETLIMQRLIFNIIGYLKITTDSCKINKWSCYNTKALAGSLAIFCAIFFVK